MEKFPHSKISRICLDCSPEVQRAGVVVKVSQGDRVGKCEVVAECEHLSVHSPVNGTVIDIEDHQVIIRPSEESSGTSETMIQKFQPDDNLTKVIAAAGISGMGGSCFPAAIKIHAAMQHKVKTVVVNAVECEPFITVDEEILLTDFEYIRSALKYLGNKLQTDDFRIAVTERFYRRNRVFMDETGFAAVRMPDSYPAGAEKLIAKKIMGRRYRFSSFPFEAGLLIHNTATLRAIGKFVSESTPLTERPMSVVWNNNSSIHNIIVPVGSKVGEIIEHVTERLPAKDEIIIAGGLMMGKRVSVNDYVSKGTNALFLVKDISMKEYPCKMCGKCIEVCPMKLSPALVAAAVDEQRKLTGSLKQQIQRCFLCGACSSVCPSRIDLVKYFRENKSRCMN